MIGANSEHRVRNISSGVSGYTCFFRLTYRSCFFPLSLASGFFEIGYQRFDIIFTFYITFVGFDSTLRRASRKGNFFNIIETAASIWIIEKSKN